MSINVRKLSFAYDKDKVLDDISFSCGEGELIALLGPNGVGKSTFFRCLLGFLKPGSGEVLIDGKDIGAYKKSELARQLAYIPQFYSPAFDHTVLDTVLMGLTGQMDIFAQPGEKEMKKAMDAIESLGISGLANRGSQKISGGERQLMLLARAIAQDARVFIMDEPTASLDYGNSFRVMEKISELKSRGYTVIFSTHEPNHVFRYASRVLAMKSGHIIADGAPDEVLNSEVLKSLYGIDVALTKIHGRGKEFFVCLPYDSQE